MKADPQLNEPLVEAWRDLYGSDKPGSFTALAWIEKKADELRILALTTASPDAGFPP